MTSKLKTDVLETVSGSGTIALTNQLSGMTDASMPAGSVVQVVQNYAATSPQIVNNINKLCSYGIIATISSSLNIIQSIYCGGWQQLKLALDYQVEIQE